jgi:carbamoyl-phosphate synthase large subunit
MILPKPHDSVFITLGTKKEEIIAATNKLSKLGFFIYSTEHTGQFLERYDILNIRLHKVSEDKKPNIRDYLINRKINLVINVPTVGHDIEKTEKILEDEYKIRRMATEFGIPVFTNIEIVNGFVNAVSSNYDFSIKSLNEFQEGL